MSDMPRRDFLAVITNILLAGSGLLGLGGLLRFLNFQTEPPRKTEFDLGPASDYAVGSRTVLPDVPAILIRILCPFVYASEVILILKLMPIAL